MPKNKVSDLITDQEMTFARLVLSGTMTDRHAAEAAGLSAATADYTKSRPRVRAYMLEHRAAVEQQIVEQETEGLRQRNVGREQILARLWEIANLSPEMTRGSINGQVKALSMIIAIENLIPDRRAGSATNTPAPPPTKPNISVPNGLYKQRGETADDEPYAAFASGAGEPDRNAAQSAAPPSAPILKPIFDPRDSAFRPSSPNTMPSPLHASAFASPPDANAHLSRK
jgi:hypothetical protein